VAQLEFDIIPGHEVNSRFCWVCGRIGEENKTANLMLCNRHPEGQVRWCIYVRHTARLNDAIVYKGVTLKAIDHSMISEAHP
jgi:hypothetical protein